MFKTFFDVEKTYAEKPFIRNVLHSSFARSSDIAIA